MSNRGVIAALVGVGAGVVLSAAYFVAPLVGVHVTAESMTVAAAIAAFAASIALLTITALKEPKKVKPAPSKRLRDLDVTAFAHFPTDGVRLVLKPDTVIDEFDIVRNPSAPDKYAKKDVFLTIKKAAGKAVFNPVVLRTLFDKLKGYENFLHILLVNEHDEYIGYIPAAFARLYLAGENAESKIVWYIVEVIANPEFGVRLRDIRGLSRHDCIFDHNTLADAQRKVTEDHLHGLIVLKEKRNRKPLGVIYEEDLVKLTMGNGNGSNHS